jgi:putative flippase GtrA
MGKVIRYGAVSVVCVVLTQVLILAGEAIGWSGTLANVVAVMLAAVPGYLLNRAWVWGRAGRHDLTREVLPFWGFAAVGLVLSTVCVAVASSMTAAPLAANVANLAAFGSLWALRYVVLDRVLFAAT